MEKSKIHYVVIAAMICITLIEINALFLGVNGVIMSAVIAAIAGLAGLMTKTPKILQVN